MRRSRRRRPRPHRRHSEPRRSQAPDRAASSDPLSGQQPAARYRLQRRGGIGTGDRPPRRQERFSLGVVSTRDLRVCACGLRRTTACTSRGNAMSSVYLAVPVSSRGSSRRLMPEPKMRGGALLWCSSRPPPPRPRRGVLNRPHDVLVSSAAAQVAFETMTDLLDGGTGIGAQQLTVPSSPSRACRIRIEDRAYSRRRSARIPSSPPVARPSIVVTLAPCACTARHVQDLTAISSSRTVHAPHWLVSHPIFVPVRPATSRKGSARAATWLHLLLPAATIDRERDGDSHGRPLLLSTRACASGQRIFRISARRSRTENPRPVLT